MKVRVLLPEVVLFCLCAVQVRAAMWCGHGTGTSLDHQCADAELATDPTVSEAILKHEERWMSIKGVWSVDSGASATGGGAEIQISADPPWAACVRNQIPTLVDSVPVVVTPIEAPAVILGGRRPVAMRGISPAYEVSKGAGDRAKDYSRIVQKYGHQWMSLPGVIGIAPAGCDCGSCDFTGVEISVQRHFMSALLKQIPPSVNGVPIILLPSD